MKQQFKMIFTALFIALLLVGCSKQSDNEEAEVAATPDEGVVAAEEENVDESAEEEPDRGKGNRNHKTCRASRGNGN